MVISIALLGYGASGAFLALAGDGAAPPPGRGLCCRRRPVRRVGGAKLCGGRAAAIQSARRDLGAAAASLSSHPLRAVCAAVLRRRHLYRACARRIPASGRSNLPLRPDRRRRRRHRPDAGAVRGLSRHGAPAGRAAWPSRRSARDQPARQRGDPEEQGGRVLGRGGCGVRCTAAVMDGAASVRIQGAQPGATRPGRKGAGRGLKPARAADGGEQSHRSAPPCARAEPQQRDRAAGPAWRLHRRRRAHRDHRL